MQKLAKIIKFVQENLIGSLIVGVIAVIGIIYGIIPKEWIAKLFM